MHVRVPVAARGDGYLSLDRTVRRVAFRRRRSSTRHGVAAELHCGKLLKPHRNIAWLQSDWDKNNGEDISQNLIRATMSELLCIPGSCRKKENL